MHMRLTTLKDGKMLTKKQAEVELKRMRNLMAARDAFLRTHKTKLENLQRKTERAKTSIAGRQQQRRDLEVREYKRLAAASQKNAESVLTQASKGELVRDATPAKQQKEVSFNSSYGVQPLHKMLIRQTNDRNLFGTQVQPRDSTYGNDDDDFFQTSMSRHTSSSGSLPIQDRPVFASSSFLLEDQDGTIVSNNDKNSHGKNPVVKGYMRVDAYQQLQDLVKANRELTASVAAMKSCLDNTIKVTLRYGLIARLGIYYVSIFHFQEHSKRIKYNATTTENLVKSVGLMKEAFLEYDLSHNINLNEAQAEIVGYLPFDELGDKVDFLLSNPATARTITKHVVMTMKPPNKGCRVSVNHVVIEASNLIFTVGLRAHLSPFRQVPKE